MNIKIPAGLTVENYRKFLLEKMECMLIFHNYGSEEIQDIVSILLDLKS